LKKELIIDIQNDFDIAFEGIKRLPKEAKVAVVVAYFYYKNLLKKIAHTPAVKIMDNRIRISDGKKIILLVKAILVTKLNLI